jgi:hypothetical protein
MDSIENYDLKFLDYTVSGNTIYALFMNIKAGAKPAPVALIMYLPTLPNCELISLSSAIETNFDSTFSRADAGSIRIC